MLNNNNHADASRLVDVVNVVDCRLSATACCLYDLGGVGGEVEVACWVESRVGFRAGNWVW
jgi:hypothetical protein